MKGRRIGLWIIACAVAVLLIAGTLQAGSIFDDDWKPPAQREQPKQELPPVKSDAPAPATPNVTPAPQKPVTPAPEPTPSTKSPAPVNRPADVVLLPPAVTKSIPSSADRAHSRKLLKEAFAEKLKDHSPGARRELAGTLIDQATASAGNLADQYVLVTGAIDAAEEGQSLDLAYRAIDLMASLFDIDALAAKNEAATVVLTSTAAWTDDGSNVRLAGDVESQLVAENDYADARRLLSAILRRAAHVNDRALSARTQNAIRELDSKQIAWDGLKSKIDRLKTAPADPGANFAVGSYLCFMVGQWDRGLPYLSRGDDAAAKSAATSEMLLSSDVNADAILKVADAWWDLAAHQTGARRSHIQRHSGVLYQRATPSLTGLKLAVAQKRLASIEPITNDAVAPHTLRGAILWMRFDNTSSYAEEGGHVTVKDLSANNNIGTLVRAKWKDASTAGGVTFEKHRQEDPDDLQERVDLANNAKGLPLDDFTISVWFMPTDDDLKPGPVWARSALIGSCQKETWFRGWFLTPKQFWWANTAGNGRRAAEINFDATAGEWNHICIVRGKKNVVVYRNGVLSGNSGEFPNEPFPVYSYGLTIGNAKCDYIPFGTRWNPFAGTIGEIIVCNRMLSATEIGQLYSEGKLRRQVHVREN